MTSIKDFRDALFDRLVKAGLQLRAREYADAARPSVEFNIDETISSSELPLGSSKLGGLPDLPLGYAWPKWHAVSRENKRDTHWKDQLLVDNGEVQLTFIGQINLADVQKDWLDIAVPNSGVLSFFYDAKRQPWGFDPADRGGWHLVWFEGASFLRTTPSPDAEIQILPERPLRGEQSVTLPPLLTEDHDLPDTQEVEDILYGQLGSDVRLGGDPDLIQNPMELECEMASHGFYAGDPQGYAEAEAAGVGPDASKWRLVLQISSSDAAGTMWGDLGNLYVWMRVSDIESGNFDRAWTILQCS